MSVMGILRQPSPTVWFVSAFVRYSVAVDHAPIYFEPLFCCRYGWHRNRVGSVAGEICGMASGDEAQDAASNAGRCRQGSGYVSALFLQSVVSDISAYIGHPDLGGAVAVR